jgi:hypothetical protein
MTRANVLPMPVSALRIRKTDSDAIRRRALERLYQRRAAVDQLIRSLEGYQHCRAVSRLPA